MFLKFCISNNIVPPHLSGFYKLKLNLYHYGSKLIVNCKKKRYAKIFLKIELNDTYRRLYHARTQVFLSGTHNQ